MLCKVNNFPILPIRIYPYYFKLHSLFLSLLLSKCNSSARTQQQPMETFIPHCAPRKASVIITDKSWKVPESYRGTLVPENQIKRSNMRICLRTQSKSVRCAWITFSPWIPRITSVTFPICARTNRGSLRVWINRRAVRSRSQTPICEWSSIPRRETREWVNILTGRSREAIDREGAREGRRINRVWRSSFVDDAAKFPHTTGCLSY